MKYGNQVRLTLEKTVYHSKETIILQSGGLNQDPTKVTFGSWILLQKQQTHIQLPQHQYQLHQQIHQQDKLIHVKIVDKTYVSTSRILASINYVLVVNWDINHYTTLLVKLVTIVTYYD